jgi:UDP-N-acetylglucosamine 1-carboxyvinyltransferase
VAEIHHIDRGYVRLDEQLRALGADVVRAESDVFGG